MTEEQRQCGPRDRAGNAWVTCARCGVTQPLANLDGTACSDAAKCAEWKAGRERELAEFRRTHPELHVKGGKKR